MSLIECIQTNTSIFQTDKATKDILYSMENIIMRLNERDMIASIHDLSIDYSNVPTTVQNYNSQSGQVCLKETWRLFNTQHRSTEPACTPIQQNTDVKHIMETNFILQALSDDMCHYHRERLVPQLYTWSFLFLFLDLLLLSQINRSFEFMEV